MARPILHLADLHIGCPMRALGDGSEVRAREADGVLERLADWLLAPGSSQVGAVLIAGDLFDSPWPDDRVVEKAARPLRRLVQAGIPVVTVPGNHDEWTYTDGVFRRWHHDSAWPGTLVTNDEPDCVASLTLDELRVEIVSCAYHQGRGRASRGWQSPFQGSRDPDERRVGLFHGTLDRIGGRVAEGERAFLLDLDGLAGWGIDYLALGHIHKRQSLTHGSCLAHYPGPLEGRSFWDSGAGVLTLVDLTPSPPRIQAVDARTTGVRSRDVGLLGIDLVRVADLDTLERTIRDHFGPNEPPPVLRVELSGRPDFPLPLEELRRRLAPSFLHFEIALLECALDLGDWRALASQRTLEGAFVRRVLGKIEEASTQEGAKWLAAAQAGLHALRGGRR